MSVAGARPNFMKIAPLAGEVRWHQAITHSIVHTGQHYDEGMSRVVFDSLGIAGPDFKLKVLAGRLKRRRVLAPRDGRAAPWIVNTIRSELACAGGFA